MSPMPFPTSVSTGLRALAPDFSQPAQQPTKIKALASTAVLALRLNPQGVPGLGATTTLQSAQTGARLTPLGTWIWLLV